MATNASGTFAKGNIRLTIDERELEATLVFDPDPQSGAEWTNEKIARLLSDCKLPNIGPKAMEDILFKFIRSKARIEEVVARGMPPTDSIPEQAEWMSLSIPPSISPFSIGIVTHAPPPELFKSRLERVKIETVVKKPGAFPFMPAKEETVISYEKKEVLVPIAVDTQVIRTGYAKKGERLGLVSQAKAGKPGKSVFGKPVLPDSLEDAVIVLGTNVSKSKNEIVADADGFVRIGSSWVDIIPFAFHSWNVEKSSGENGIILNFYPGDPRIPLPESRDIVANAIHLGAKEESLISEREIDTLLKRSLQSGAPLLGAVLSRSREAEIVLDIGSDSLRATLTLRKSVGKGKPLDLKELGETLHSKALKIPNLYKVKEDIIAFVKGPQFELVDLLLVEGKAPTRGKDRQVICSVTFLPEEAAKPLRERLAARTSYQSAGTGGEDFPATAAEKFAYVQKDQTIASLSRLEIGEAGIDVFGNVLHGIPGNDPLIQLGENLRMSQGSIISEVSGILLFSSKAGEYRFRSILYRDGLVDVSLSPDDMTAFITLQKELGAGLPLTVEKVFSALQAKGIVKGVDVKAVNEAVKHAQAGEIVHHAEAARGQRPVPAGGQKIEFLIGLGRDGGGKGSEPIRTEVKEGDAIAVLGKRSTQAEKGSDVFGKSVEPEEIPQTRQFTHDETIREEPRPDGDLNLIAMVSGELREKDGKLGIEAIKTVKGDVLQTAGSLKFPGSVQISGSVGNGASVIAGGDAFIAKGAEASLISANGKIVLGMGIRGARKGALRASKTIDAHFAEQATILAVEDIRLNGSCVLCSVKTNGKLLLSGEKGTLVGGLVRARRGVEAQNVGSERGMKTEISFGQDYLIADQIEAEEAEIDRIKNAVIQYDMRMRELERKKIGLDQVRQEKLKLMKLLEKRSLRLFNLREKFEEHFPSEIRVRGTVYPGVVLESHSRFYEVKQRKSNVSFSFDRENGRIVERSL